MKVRIVSSVGLLIAIIAFTFAMTNTYLIYRDYSEYCVLSQSRNTSVYEQMTVIMNRMVASAILDVMAIFGLLFAIVLVIAGQQISGEIEVTT